jgi:hypothetical protein
MAVFIPLEDMEQAHAAYNACSEELADALTEVKAKGSVSKEELKKIADINRRCDELLQVYLEAFNKYYGQDV